MYKNAANTANDFSILFNELKGILTIHIFCTNRYSAEKKEQDINPQFICFACVRVKY